MKLFDLWTLFPIGAGGLLGVVARYNINHFADELGFDRQSEKIAGAIITMSGSYLMLTGKGYKKNVGSGLAVIGMVVLMASLYPDTLPDNLLILAEAEENEGG